MLRRLGPWLDSFLPDWMHQQGPDMVRRGRTAVLIAWLMGTMFGAVLILRLSAAEWTSAAIDLGLVVSCYGAPYLVRWTGRYYEVAHVMLGAVFALLCYLGVTNPNPGLNAATTALAEIPLFAIILFGVRGGYAWSVACALAVLGIGVSDFEVLTAPTQAERAAFNEHGAVLVMCVTLISVGLFYERGKDDSLKRISELESSRREAELQAVRTQAAAKVQEAERFASMGRLSAAVAHEINNPLSFVGGNLAFIQKQLKSIDEPVRDALEESLDGVERIRRIVTDLQNFTRPATDDSSQANVARAAQAAVAMAEPQTRAKADVIMQIQPDLAAACDEARLAQVLLNLLVNAAQAMPEGRRGEHSIVVEGWRDDAWVHLEVQDDGPGVPEEIITRVREPFFTTKPVGQGTGLGLAVSEGIARSYGGRLELESEPGRTVVRVVLPAVDQEAESDSVATSTAKAQVRSMVPKLRILICDDERMVARAIKPHLSEHDVELLDGGREVLRQLADDREYDLILCDVMMPDVTGMDVFGHVEEHHPELVERMLFMSGGTYTETAQAFRERIGTRFLEKPIVVERLLERVQEAQGRKERGR